MERTRNASSSSASEATTERARMGGSAKRAANGDDVVVAAPNGQLMSTSTALRRVAMSSHAEQSPSSSSSSSPRIPGALSNNFIAKTAEPEASALQGSHLDGHGNARLAHKDSFGFQRRTSSIVGSPGRQAPSSNLATAPVDSTMAHHAARPSVDVYQDSRESIDVVGGYIEDPDTLKENARSVASASDSLHGAQLSDAERSDLNGLESRTMRKLSLGNVMPAPLPGARKDSLHGNTLATAPSHEGTDSFDAAQDVAASRSPLSHTRNMLDLPSLGPQKGSSVQRPNGAAKTPTSWTIPAAGGQSAWTVEAADGGRDTVPANTSRNNAPMSKQGSTTSDYDAPRKPSANRTRNHAVEDAEDASRVKEHSAQDAGPTSSLITASSSRNLASRRQRSGSSKTGPQLPSAMNVLPASPPAMYWSKVPVHGSVPRRSFRAHSACLSEEVMWLFGGCDSKGCFRDLWCFDTETMCWSKPKATGDLPPPRRAHSATMVDKRLYVFAGGDGPYYFNDLYVFDTIALRWTKPDVFGQPPSPRRAHTSNYYNGQLIIFGGGNGVGALNDVYSLDLTDTNRLEWRKLPCTGKVPIGRGYHTSNLVDGKLIVIGGSDGHMSFNDIHILRLDTKVWYQIKTDETHNRLGHTATQVGSYLFIVGGHDSHSYTPDILTLNLVNLQWEPRSVCGKKPPGRGYHQAWLRDSRLFVHGGFDGKEIYDDLYHIDLSAASYIPQITSFSVEPEQLDDE